jgi:hypothetical protein
MEYPTALGGTLCRIGPDDWHWSDGTPEPRVFDLSPSVRYNFCVRDGAFVEVFLSTAHSERALLGWVLEGVESGEYPQAESTDHTGPLMMTDEGPTRMRVEPGEDPLLGNEPIIHKRAIPRVALVPIAVWDQWAAEHPHGATWSKDDARHIFAKARQLGWKQIA